ncbi:S9 family peptidase [Prevotella sp. 10(H)]|uniref:alpha/beta hydrolase family protein n=1 Tax=Prevotella sp. 10(H) TaxID=1158294 RepID=UPI0004A73AF2|nr:alpha/beta fold hydrolase [Prevotella sp. 10(H)]
MKIRRILLLMTSVCISLSSLYAIRPEKKYRFYPEKLGLIYKDLDVTTKDNLKIKTWFFPAQPELSEEAYEKAWNENKKKEYKTLDHTKRPTLIISNSDAGNMSWVQLHIAQEMTSRGINVVTFDWRDFGESSDWPMNTDYMSYTEMLWDYDAVVNTVAKEQVVDASKIIVMGWSTGSYLSMITAYNNPLVSAYIGIATPSSFEELMPIVWGAQTDKEKEVIVAKDFPTRQMPVYIAPEFHKPTFLIVGDKDDRTPLYMTENIYNLLPGDVKKDKWIVEGAEHGGENGPVTFNLENFITKINEFIQTAFDKV